MARTRLRNSPVEVAQLRHVNPLENPVVPVQHNFPVL